MFDAAADPDVTHLVGFTPQLLLTCMLLAMQQQFTDSMVGIVCDTDFGVIDEAPQAYKDLTTVMANQEDMVDVVHRLLPLLNVKGFEKGGGSKYKKGKRKQKQ